MHSKLVDCTFEYPSLYSRASTDKSVDDQISIHAYIRNKINDVDSSIYVYVTRPDEWLPDYTSLLESSLSIAERNPGFSLIERSPITVADTQGEKIVYYYSMIGITHEIGKENLIPSITFVGFFESGDLLWEINIHAIIEKTDLAKTTFEHVLNTITIHD